MTFLPKPSSNRWRLAFVAMFAVCSTAVAVAQPSTSSAIGAGGMTPSAARAYVAEGNAIYAAIMNPPAAPAAEVPFINENDAAMVKMVACMAVNPTGDVDRDFVAMMVPHHQGAIDMAEAELRYGHNEQLLRISQEIIVEQLQEIAAMHIAVGEKVSRYQAMLAASVPRAEPTAATPSASNAGAAVASLAAEAPFLGENSVVMTKMMRDMTIKPTGNIDRDFVAMMVPHHQGAIDMAQAELRYGKNAHLRRIAKEIIVDQMKEIALMRLAVGELLPPSASSPTDPPPTQSFPSLLWMPVCGNCPSAE